MLFAVCCSLTNNSAQTSLNHPVTSKSSLARDAPNDAIRVPTHDESDPPVGDVSLSQGPNM